MDATITTILFELVARICKLKKLASCTIQLHQQLLTSTSTECDVPSRSGRHFYGTLAQPHDLIWQS